MDWLDDILNFIPRADWDWREYDGTWRFVSEFKHSVNPLFKDYPIVYLHHRDTLHELAGFLGDPCDPLDSLNPDYVTTDTITIMDEIMNACCEDKPVQTYRPSLLDTLTAKQLTLSQQLGEVEQAIEALKRNPELQVTLDLLRKVARF